MKLYKNRWNKKREKRGGTNIIELSSLSGKKNEHMKYLENEAL